MKTETLSSRSGIFGPYLFTFWFVVATLATGQDALFAFLKNTSFYWSESLLYKVYWLLFIPLTFLVNLALKKWPIERIISVNSAKHLTLALLSSLVHTLIFSILMAVMSELLLGYSFSFTGVLRKSLAEDFFTGLLMYSLLLLLLNRSLRHGAPDLPTLGLGTLKVETINPDHLTVFLIKDGGRSQRIPAETIDWLGSEDSYTVLHRGDQKWLYSESLSRLETRLNPTDFIRIHRSCLVNVHRVRHVTSRLTGDYDVHLDSGKTVRLSRHYVQKAKGQLL